MKVISVIEQGMFAVVYTPVPKGETSLSNVYTNFRISKAFGGVDVSYGL